ncbi:MAG: sigma-70 family RNA polymerase sigma factor [Rhodothermales bacterium]|nr:sigma-70 family RNA polymerase sigma factor [Rhodothermales bacterium]MBO6779087.1 sigma-70 family RNA polymerase sigma factor [Rhodothermales bacterium]
MASRPQTNAALARLVDRARKGDRDAEATLLTSLEPVIRSYFRRRVGDHAELDDLVQNTLLRVFRGLADVQDGHRIRGFTLKAALFELQDLYRGRYGSREATVLEDLPEPSVRPETSGVQLDLDRALSVLTPKARKIIELKALGYRYEEIAGMVDTTEAAVKMQVKRALEKMRAILASAVAWLLPAGLLVQLLTGLSFALLLFATVMRLEI